MATLFISHSSKDNAEATQLCDWLREHGFTALFLDIDDTDGIKPSEDWEKTLYREIRRSQAVLLLLTDHWHASKWCFAEYTQARALGKVVIPLRLQAGLKESVAADVQNLDLFADRDHQLRRLHAELIEITVNTQHGLKWDNRRAPYPGMMAFEAEDAPVFFGRDAEIKQLRERLVGCRNQNSASVLVMLAASGAGKSSLLKAGLLPRLRRDAKHWLVLPAVRPEKAPLAKLAQQLATQAGDAATWQTLYKDLQGEQALNALKNAIEAIQTRSQQWQATLLISLDQAEELFSTADPQETAQFLHLLRLAETAELPLMTLLAMRSDYLPALQTHTTVKHSAGTLHKALFPLAPLPLERVGELIRGPADIAGLVVEDGLISAASKDADTDDALPLLAFALRELHDRYGADGDLTLDEYQRLGSDTLNPLENAVQRKAEQALQAASPNDADLQALRAAFIPHMVRVNEAGDYVRQPAPWVNLPEQARGLLDKLTNARLLIQRQETGDEKTVEVAHEALLRHWPLLNGWLTEEHDFLLGKQQLEHSLHQWQHLPAADKDMGLLQGIALQRAQEWLFTNRSGLNDAERAYIHQSHQAEEARRAAEEKRRKQQRNRLIGFSIVVLIVAALAVWQAISARAAEQQAETQSQRAELARHQAEGVIEFMVFDLRDKLKPIGQLDILHDVQERVNSYYENSGENSKNQKFLWQRAVNLSQQADTLVAQGRLSEAEKRYREANQFMQKRADSEPSNAQWQRDLSVSLNKIGDILQAQGKLDDARALFEQSRDIAAKLATDDPSNAQSQRDLSVSLEKIGDILRAQGKLDDARALFEQSRDIFQKRATDDPSNAQSQRDLSVSLNNIGDILRVQGKLDDARAVFEQDLAIAQKLATDDPSNAQSQRDLSVSLGRIGDILRVQGKLDDARAVFEQSRDIREKLATDDPSNAQWQRDLSVSLEKIGDILRAQGKLDDARAVFEQSRDIREKLATDDPSNAQWQYDLGISHERLGIVAQSQGKLDKALRHYKIRNKLIEKLATDDPSNAQWQRDLSVSLEKIGDILRAQGKLDDARAVFEQSRDIREKLATDDPSNAGWQTDVVVSHVKLLQLALQTNDHTAAHKHGEQALAILHPLAKQGLLHGEQQQWIGIVEEMMTELEN